MNTFWQDVRYGVRMLLKSPGFTAIAVLTLALGIGANTAIFSLTDQVLLRSLPVKNPGELVNLRSPGPTPGHYWSDGIEGSSFSYLMYKDLRAETTHVFSGLLATYPTDFDVLVQGSAERAKGDLVSGNYFETLGVTPALGRVLMMSDETAPGANPVVVLSYGYWARRFGSDPRILNTTIEVNGTSLTIVGVARAGFDGVQIGYVPDLFIPITMKDQTTYSLHALDDRTDHWVQILGRLKPGMTPVRAEAAIDPGYHAILESADLPVLELSGERRQRFLAKTILLDPGAQGRPILQIDAKAPLLTLTGLVGLVLLIACANIASLLAARGEARQREIAMRLVLGAGRWRLVRQLLTEGLILSLIGGAFGLVVASWTLNFLVSSLKGAEGILGLTSSLDVRVLVFALGVTILSALLFALAPAMRATHGDLQSALKEQGISTTSSAESVRLRKWLIVSQVGLTAVLLVFSGLFVQSLIQLNHANLGITSDHTLQFSVAPELKRYNTTQAVQLIDRVREGVAALPGVRSVGAAVIPIFQDDEASRNITLEGYNPQPDENMDCQENWISPGYFSAMGIPLMSGREFTEADTATSPMVAIINEKLAKKFFSGRNPIGMHIGLGPHGSMNPGAEIVGVVQDSKHDNVRDPISPFMYFPYTQKDSVGQATFYVHTHQEPTALAGAVRKLVASYDARLPVFGMKTLTAQVNESMYADRMVTFLSMTLGALAALLAAVGLYGVMAYVVARRTHEIGIRMALGARKKDVMLLVLRQGAKLAALGIACGVMIALALARLVSSLLYGVSASDLMTFAAVPILLALVALAACYFPARRAMRVDPMAALRYE
jgi:putative ABC transport system permease protein